MAEKWTAERILQLTGGYKAASIVGAAADLDLFTCLSGEPAGAAEVANRLDADLRGTTILLDALCALELLVKRGDRYALADGIPTLLTEGAGGGVLSMVRHHSSLQRRWTRLATVVREGRPTDRVPSLRGAEADHRAFIEAMNDVCEPIADEVVADLGSLEFRCVLDLGGGPGTWTAAFLRAHPGSRGILFDLPEVIPIADRRLSAAGFGDRVDLVAGDFTADPLPNGADLVWLSAIVHQNSREQNRRLFRSIHQALVPGGSLLIRDVLMDPSHTAPAFGALFAVNMLVCTEGGGTFTLQELEEDLEAMGFTGVERVREVEDMSSVVLARKPEGG